MDSKRAPQDKLTYVSRACNYLYKSIHSSKKEPATADDLLSCLIYSTLKANPPRLWSNLQYITRFCNPRRLMTGESGYYFTSLVSIQKTPLWYILWKRGCYSIPLSYLTYHLHCACCNIQHRNNIAFLVIYTYPSLYSSRTMHTDEAEIIGTLAFIHQDIMMS